MAGTSIKQSGVNNVGSSKRQFWSDGTGGLPPAFEAIKQYLADKPRPAPTAPKTDFRHLRR